MSHDKEAPRPPDHLEAATAAWWSAVISDYDLEPHHIRLLTLAAEAWDRGQQARRIIAAEGLTFVDRFSQPKTRPEVSIERDSRLAFARLVRELCLDAVEPPDAAARPPRAGGAKW